MLGKVRKWWDAQVGSYAKQADSLHGRWLGRVLVARISSEDGIEEERAELAGGCGTGSRCRSGSRVGVAF